MSDAKGSESLATSPARFQLSAGLWEKPFPQVCTCLLTSNLLLSANCWSWAFFSRLLKRKRDSPVKTCDFYSQLVGSGLRSQYRLSKKLGGEEGSSYYAAEAFDLVYYVLQGFGAGQKLGACASPPLLPWEGAKQQWQPDEPPRNLRASFGLLSFLGCITVSPGTRGGN